MVRETRGGRHRERDINWWRGVSRRKIELRDRARGEGDEEKYCRNGKVKEIQ